MPGTLRLSSVITPSPCLPCAGESSPLAGIVNFLLGLAALVYTNLKSGLFIGISSPAFLGGGGESRTASTSLGHGEDGARVLSAASYDSPGSRGGAWRVEVGDRLPPGGTPFRSCEWLRYVWPPPGNPGYGA